jgi:hypothetical protein
MGTPVISVAVMAHPSRDAFIPDLLAALDRPAEVVWDQKQDRWDTGRRAMLAYDPAATHHLVVQDDAIVCRDLVAGLEQAVNHVPEGVPLCLYIGTVRPKPQAVAQLVKAAAATSWIVMDSLYWGVGVVVPTRHIDTMIAWCDQRTRVANYDLRMSRWFEAQRIPVWYPWPSLVEHRDSPSLVPGRTAQRHARQFIGADVSALDQPWDRPQWKMRAGSTLWRDDRTMKVRRLRDDSKYLPDIIASPHWQQVEAYRCSECGRPNAHRPVADDEVIA